MQSECFEQLTLFDLGQQEVTVDFEGGRVVSDAGLLSLRAFEKKLGIISGLGERFPDPCSQQFITYTSTNILSQRVYQILAGRDIPKAFITAFTCNAAMFRCGRSVT